MSTSSGDPSAERELDDVHRQWETAVRRRDLDALLELLAPDYVLWPAGRPPITAAEGVRAVLAAALEHFDIEPSFECESRLVDANVAVERGWDVQVVRPRDGGPERTVRQRVMLVLTRDSRRQWRFAWGMSQPGEAPGASS